MIELKLLKNNDQKEWSDTEWVQEFFDFLTGTPPESIKLRRKMKLAPETAFKIIWYLQEHFPIIPDTIEKCDNCDAIYNSDREGYYSEQGNEIGQFFCGACDHLAPYDND